MTISQMTMETQSQLSYTRLQPSTNLTADTLGVGVTTQFTSCMAFTRCCQRGEMFPSLNHTGSTLKRTQVRITTQLTLRLVFAYMLSERREIFKSLNPTENALENRILIAHLNICSTRETLSAEVSFPAGICPRDVSHYTPQTRQVCHHTPQTRHGIRRKTFSDGGSFPPGMTFGVYSK